MTTQLGPKGDMRCRGVLSVIVNLPGMQIPPWYWFRKVGTDIQARIRPREQEGDHREIGSMGAGRRELRKIGTDKEALSKKMPEFVQGLQKFVW